jgi:choline dehydrogenase-like flavoprotein
MGTARMGISAEHSVVNADLKVFGFDNLYICDASVFPSGGNANPSLTISALTFYAMEKLTR